MPYGHVMVMQQFGENLEKLMKKYSKFSRYTTSTIGMQMVRIIIIKIIIYS